MIKTAWFDEETIASSMLNSGFKPLRHSDHFKSLNECIGMTDGVSLLDLGCGVGEVSETFTQFKYTGADLPHIIENASRKKYPDSNFLHFNANEGEYDFVGDYDVVLMNSFISEIPDWYRVLNNVLLHAKSFVIIHRQRVTEYESFLENYLTYADMPTIQTIINYDVFVKTFEMNGLELIHECDSFENDTSQRTFLFKKRG